MKSYLSWDPAVEKGGDTITKLPESAFDCPKLNRGDFMSLDIGLGRGSRALIPVKVAHVSVSVAWNKPVRPGTTIRDVEQYLYVEPVVLEKDS